MTLMQREFVWLDLCSGLGGASQPALDRGWRVIRLDIDPRFKPDIVADVRALPLKPFHIDVLWASTPCQEFSKHGMMRTFFPSAPIPDFSLAAGVAECIRRFRPAWWMLENVSGAVPFLSPWFGAYIKSGSHRIWARLPGLLPQTGTHKGGDYKIWGARVARVRKAAGLPDDWRPARGRLGAECRVHRDSQKPHVPDRPRDLSARLASCPMTCYRGRHLRGGR